MFKRGQKIFVVWINDAGLYTPYPGTIVSSTTFGKFLVAFKNFTPGALIDHDRMFTDEPAAYSDAMGRTRKQITAREEHLALLQQGLREACSRHDISNKPTPKVGDYIMVLANFPRGRQGSVRCKVVSVESGAVTVETIGRGSKQFLAVRNADGKWERA